MRAKLLQTVCFARQTRRFLGRARQAGTCPGQKRLLLRLLGLSGQTQSNHEHVIIVSLRVKAIRKLWLQRERTA